MAKARICDRCNKTLSAEYKDDYYVVEVTKYNIEHSGHCWLQTIELCEECLKTFNDFIKVY